MMVTRFEYRMICKNTDCPKPLSSECAKIGYNGCKDLGYLPVNKVVKEVETFSFNDSIEMHIINDLHCSGCFSNTQKCQCGGVIHNEFGGQDCIGTYINYLCDRCGVDYLEVNE